MGGDCGLCHSEGPDYRCEDCFGGLMFCQRCMVNMHACMPLHRIEVRSCCILRTCIINIEFL
jgi:hypothetical protein